MEPKKSLLITWAWRLYRPSLTTANAIKIAGVILKEGFIRRNSKIKVMRDEEQIFSGRIKSMHHVREKITEIKNGSEGGILLDGFDDYEVGDNLICEKETRS